MILRYIYLQVKAEGLTVGEIIMDKDSSMNAKYCTRFPDGQIAYCSNHNAKTMHRDLQKVKPVKCEVRQS